MKEIEIDDVELMELLDQLDDVALRQSNARLGLLSKLELPLQLQQLVVHRQLPIAASSPRARALSLSLSTRESLPFSDGSLKKDAVNNLSIEMGRGHIRPIKAQTI